MQKKRIKRPFTVQYGFLLNTTDSRFTDDLCCKKAGIDQKRTLNVV